MSESTQQLIASALQLAPADRAVVANAILASLEGFHRDEPGEVCGAWSDELVARLQESRRQLDEGEFTEYDDGSLNARFAELKAKAAARSQS